MMNNLKQSEDGIVKKLIQRVWAKATACVVAQVVAPDPWEPDLMPGQYVVRAREESEVVPSGEVLAVCDSPEAAFRTVCNLRSARYWLTWRAVDGEYETADERSAFRLIWSKVPLPGPSPMEVAECLRAMDEASRAA